MPRILSLLCVFLIGSIAFNGCARKIVLHPVDETDIRSEGNWVCMTPEFIQEVMKARLGK